ncbi:MAG: class I SAM-dependent methyltransferase [Candidatus Omnitrophica bacterium]|nr:class I SAM-dependent methyltransferase [Candidatus Omnitrophota bacterium]
MNDYTFESLARREDDNHWFFAQRKFILKDLMQSFIFPDVSTFRILDIGCGTGGTTRELSGYGKVTGLEPNPKAVSLIRKRFSDLEIVQGGTSELTDLFAGTSFDLVTIFNVLYHSEATDPQTVLEDAFRLMKPGGWMLWTEPAYPILKRKMDRLVHCKRRFHPEEMRAIITSAGFRIRFRTDLMGWLFPAALVLACINNFSSVSSPADSNENKEESLDQKKLPIVINNFLYNISKIEWKISRNIPLKVGTSHLLLAQKI